MSVVSTAIEESIAGLGGTEHDAMVLDLNVHAVLANELTPVITTLRNYAVADRPSLDALADRLEKLLD